MDTQPLTVDGFVHLAPAPGTRPGTAQFELISSPTDDAEDDTVFSCTTEQPRIAAALLTEVQPGDLLRVLGTLAQPGTTGGSAQFTVDTLEVLAAAPARAQMVLDRYGDYVVVFTTDTDAVPVFTAQGRWVGLADTPDTISTLIHLDECVNGGDV